MLLEDFGLSINVIEMFRDSKQAKFDLNQTRLLLPEQSDFSFKKSLVLRAVMTWHGKLIANIYFSKYSGENNIDVIVRCPVLKSNSRRHFEAWLQFKDTFGPIVNTDDLCRTIFDQMQSYAGTNRARVQKLVVELKTAYGLSDGNVEFKTSAAD